MAQDIASYPEHRNHGDKQHLIKIRTHYKLIFASSSV